MRDMSKAKGNRTRYKCIEYYEDLGYQVETVEKTHRFAKIKDLFGLFDLLAIKDREVLFIQVKTNTPATQKPFKNWAQAHCSKSIRCICWTWYDRKGPRIQEYLPNRKIEEEDLR